jgi:hypothetical protein
MNYKPLDSVLRQIRLTSATQGLDTPLRGSGKLPVGWHSVVVSAIDTTRLADQGRFTITVDSDGHIHKQSIFTLNRDNTELGHNFRILVRGLFDTDDKCTDYVDVLLEDQEQAIQMLRGMKIDVDIQPESGYIVDKAQGSYVAKEATTGKVLTQPLDRIKDARTSAEAQGYKRSYNRIKNAEATFPEENYQTLQNARQAILSTEDTSGPTEPDLAAD